MYFIKSRLLNNSDLEEMCKNHNVPLIGVFPKDKLEYTTPTKGAYIINLDDSDGGGTHWVGLILDKYISYFDSFGIKKPQDIRDFIWRYIDENDMSDACIYSTKQIQHLKSDYCGYFVFFFLYHHLVINKGRSDNISLITEHNDLYRCNNRKINDKIIEKLIKNIK